MQFLYMQNLSDQIVLKDDEFRHIIKARREKIGSFFNVRNLKDDYIYTYELTQIDKKSAILNLKKSEFLPKKGGDFRLIWAIIDPKTIEKSLPSLNEMGVGGIDFVYTAYSQKNFKIDLERFKRILISSCEQCGRSDLMDLNIYESLQTFLKKQKDFFVLDFGGKNFSKNNDIKAVFVGCEGGFSEDERKLFDNDKILGLDSKFILKSSSAACAVAAKILL